MSLHVGHLWPRCTALESVDEEDEDEAEAADKDTKEEPLPAAEVADDASFLGSSVSKYCKIHVKQYTWPQGVIFGATGVSKQIGHFNPSFEEEDGNPARCWL